MELLDMANDFQNIDFDSFRGIYGSEFTDEMITHSVQSASDFFHIENPGVVYLSPSDTGVYLQDTHIFGDDVLNIDVHQLQSMGISTQDSLDLVMTHETAHRILQGMEDLNLTFHQEELCCDFMAGVRAGLNGIDISQMEHSLENTTDSITHPDGHLRVDALREGVEFVQSFMAENLSAPSFDECLNHFNQGLTADYPDFSTEAIDRSNQLNELHETLDSSFDAMRYWASRMEDAADMETMQKIHDKFMEAKDHFDTVERRINDPEGTGASKPQSTESLGSIAHNNTGDKHAFKSVSVEFKGYTKSEIDRHISDAEHRKASAESNMRHNAKLMSIKGSEPHEFEQHQYNSAKTEYDKAVKDLNKWRYEKPDDK